MPNTPQGVSGETVSREVMALLMRAPGTTGGNFDLRVGPPSESFPGVLLPPGTVPEVTAVGASDVTVIGRHPSLDLTSLFEQLPRVIAAGWTAQGPLMRGFVGTPAGFPLSVCRDRVFAAISFAPREAGGVYVRVTVRSDPRQSCVPRSNPMFADVNVPMLTPPAGARLMGGGGGGGGADEMYSRARLESAITPRAAAAHYVRQFERAGWKVVGRANEGDAVSVTRLATTSTIGDAITGLLVVTRLEGSNDLDLLLHIVRNQMSRGRPGAPTPGGMGGVTGTLVIPR